MFFYSRIASNLSLYSRRTIYNTIIQLHFDYCSSLLYILDNNSKGSFQKLQNRDMRILLRCNRYTPIKSMLNLNWITVEARFYFLAMIFFFLIVLFILMSWRSSAIAVLPLNQDRRTHRQLHNTHSLRHCHLPQLRLELRIGNSD